MVIKRATYVMTIDNGKVEARVDPATYDQEGKMQNHLHNVLNDRFLGAQLFTHKVYSLSKASMYSLLPDGRKASSLVLESSDHALLTERVDIVKMDKDGNIVSDSRKERIEKEKRLSEFIEKYRPKDKVLAAMLASHQMSVEDTSNVLVHLYEIRDALSDKFGGADNARAELTITKANWSRLGKLANDEPLRQGRHRGKQVGELRNATESELEEARSIASTMIENYLEYLEKQNLVG